MAASAASGGAAAVTVQVANAVCVLLDLSRQYPDEEIRVTLQNGTVRLGIPTGASGDRLYHAWQAVVPSLLVGMS